MTTIKPAARPQPHMDSALRARSESLDLQAHGDVSTRELSRLGLQQSQVIDFAVNVNPLGYAPEVARAITAGATARYPERYAESLCEALAEHCEVDSAEILVGNGATDLIWQLMRALGEGGRKLLCLEPTFSEARRAANACSMAVDDFWADVTADFAWDFPRLEEKLSQSKPDVVYVCAPNNPTGIHPDRQQLLELARNHHQRWFVFDESFLSLSHYFKEAWVEHPPNVIRLRSLTKDLGIPGARLGYLLAHPDILAYLRTQQPPWTVNALALSAGRAGLRSWQHVEWSRKTLLLARSMLALKLDAAGYHAIPSSTIFMLVRVGNAHEVTARCRAQGVLVRDCSSFGLPQFIRICARPESDHQRLLTALGDRSQK